MTANQDPTATKQGTEGISIPRLRRIVLAALAVAVVVFTTAVFVLVDGIFANFGPAAEKDLEWIVARGAKELATAADLGIAVADANEVRKAFDDYVQSEDVVAIVAVDAEDNVIAQHGAVTGEVAGLFEGKPGSVREGLDVLIAWSPAVIEGAEVGKLALVMSTRRLVAAQELLLRMRLATGLAGLLALVLGTLVVNRFTSAVAERDAQLAEYAATLEQKVEDRTKALDARNRGMRLVLDNVEQGFITIDPQGVMAAERSAIVDRWLGEPGEGMLLQDYVAPADEHASMLLEMGIDQIQDDILPIEVVVDQMPKRMSLGTRTLSFGYTPISDEDQLSGLLVVLTDVTAQVERERMEREQRELLRIFERMSVDRSGFLEFFAEASELVRSVIEDDNDLVIDKRLIHTLKGNSGVFELQSVAEVCHEIETRMEDESRGLEPDDRRALKDVWNAVAQKVEMLHGDRSQRVLQISENDYLFALSRARHGASADELSVLLSGWQQEPISLRFNRVAEQAKALSRRLGKRTVDIHVEGEDLRLDPETWRSFWSAFVHAVRNAVDHGIEDDSERESKGKPERGQLWFDARRTNNELVMTLRDDGHGIDWSRVALRADQLGVPHDTTRDLEMALFADGLSTRTAATSTSGRGVGMSALRDATEALGGTIRVRTELDRGTTFEFRFPQTNASA